MPLNISFLVGRLYSNEIRRSPSVYFSARKIPLGFNSTTYLPLSSGLTLESVIFISNRKGVISVFCACGKAPIAALRIIDVNILSHLLLKVPKTNFSSSSRISYMFVVAFLQKFHFPLKLLKRLDRLIICGPVRFRRTGILQSRAAGKPCPYIFIYFATVPQGIPLGNWPEEPRLLVVGSVVI